MAFSYSSKSLLLNGSTQYCTAGDVHGFEYTDDFSASCWCKTTVGGLLMSRMCTQPGGNNFYRGWLLSTSGMLLRNRNSTGNQIYVSGTNSVVDGNWHHVAATWKGNAVPVAADVSIYFDGVLEVPNVITDNLSATIVYPGEQFNVGARAGLVSFDDAFFDGTVDEAAVYDKTLSASEVLWLYCSGIARDLKGAGAPSNLVGWWHMGEDLAINTIPDQQGSNNLTMIGSPVVQDDAPGLTQYQSTYLTPPHWPLYTSEPAFEPEYDSTYLEHESADHTFVQTFGGGGPTTYFKMRAQDDGGAAPGYVTWITQGEPDFSGTGFSGGSPTPSGSMIPGSAQVVARWEE